jgi:hypothetical protein
MAKASRFIAPNLSNATPASILDEMGRLSIMENTIKKLRAYYKQAYFARTGIDPEKFTYNDKPFPTLEGVVQQGETFIATTTASFPSRVSTELLKENYPDVAAACLVDGKQLTTRFSLREGVVNPVVNDLLEQMKKELDLDQESNSNPRNL